MDIVAHIVYSALVLSGGSKLLVPCMKIPSSKSFGILNCMLLKLFLHINQVCAVLLLCHYLFLANGLKYYT